MNEIKPSSIWGYPIIEGISREAAINQFQECATNKDMPTAVILADFCSAYPDHIEALICTCLEWAYGIDPMTGQQIEGELGEPDGMAGGDPDSIEEIDDIYDFEF